MKYVLILIAVILYVVNLVYTIEGIVNIIGRKQSGIGKLLRLWKHGNTIGKISLVFVYLCMIPTIIIASIVDIVMIFIRWIIENGFDHEPVRYDGYHVYPSMKKKKKVNK